MTFRASNVVAPRAYDEIKGLMVALKRAAGNVAARLASDTPADYLLSAMAELTKFKTRLQAVASAPGLLVYAKDAEGDPAYDVVAEYQSVLAALNAAFNGIKNNFPADGSGYILAETLDANGQRVPRTFPAGALVARRNEFLAIVASID